MNFNSKIKAAGFAGLLLIFAACSHLESSSNAEINFQLNMARLALSDMENLKISVELIGTDGVEQSDIKDVDASSKNVEFTFEGIPLGLELYAQAEIFVEEENVKKVLYSGKSEKEIIKEGRNVLSLTLKKVLSDDKDNGDDVDEEPEEVIDYNIVTKSDKAYTVERPTFTIEWDDADGRPIPLETNEISFNKAKNHEGFVWEPADKDIKIADYQKAIITYKGTKLKNDEENVIAFFTKRGGYRTYGGDRQDVLVESSSFEMLIPQGKGYSQLLIQNKWATENGQNGWEKDFSFEIEKIELVKDSALAIDYSKDSYVDEKIELLRNINNEPDYSIGHNSIKWTSKEFAQNGNDSGWAAAYWEFEKLTDYDVISVTVRGKNPNQYGMRFGIHGHRPFYTRIDNNEEQVDDIHSIIEKDVLLENADQSYTIQVSLADLCTYAESYDPGAEVKSFVPTAVEFQNLSFAEEGAWTDNMVWGDDWTLIIEKIELIKVTDVAETESCIEVNLPEAVGEVNVNVKQISDAGESDKGTNPQVIEAKEGSSIVFTVEAGYDSYTWTVDGEEVSSGAASSYTLNLAEEPFSQAPVGSIFAIVLLAHKEEGDLDHSYTAQVKVIE
ncbi:MAG: hypothetical protein IJ688_01400 [Treponema sp.]|nr:hypothetical protein [Treponema sp.]